VQDNNVYGGKTTINPRFFSNPFDRLAQAATVKFSRTISQATPLRSDVVKELTPGTASVAQGASLETFANWAENNYRSNWVCPSACFWAHPLIWLRSTQSAQSQ
jgi:hypothetical protein